MKAANESPYETLQEEIEFIIRGAIAADSEEESWLTNVKDRVITILNRIEYESTNRKATPEARANAKYLCDGLATDPLQEILKQERRQETLGEPKTKEKSEFKGVETKCSHCGRKAPCVTCKGCEEPVCEKCQRDMKSSGDGCLG